MSKINNIINAIKTNVSKYAKSNNSMENNIIAKNITEKFTDDKLINSGFAGAMKGAFGNDAMSGAGLQQKFGNMAGFDMLGSAYSHTRQGNYGEAGGVLGKMLMGNNTGAGGGSTNLLRGAGRAAGYTVAGMAGVSAAKLGANAVWNTASVPGRWLGGG